MLLCAGVQPAAGGGDADRGGEEPETTTGSRQPAGLLFYFWQPADPFLSFGQPAGLLFYF